MADKGLLRTPKVKSILIFYHKVAMFHNPFHGYSPPNYQLNPSTSSGQADPLPIIPARIIKLAKDSGGEFIHPSGDSIYKWTYDRMHVAWWNGSNFGSWFEWTKEEIPTGILKPL